MRNRINEGIKDMGIVDMDKLKINWMEYKEENEKIKMKKVMKKMNVKGIREKKMIDVRMDLKNMKMKIKMMVN